MRNGKKNGGKTAVITVCLILTVFLVICAANLWKEIFRMEEDAMREARRVAVVPMEEAVFGTEKETDEYALEDPDEWLKIQCALEEAVADFCAGKISREALAEVMGFDYDYVVRVVMAESGGESEELQRAICQCIKNACFYSGNRRSPYDVAASDFTSPAAYATDSVWHICGCMFIAGDLYVPAVNALYVYNADMCRSDWHESKPYVMSLYAANGDEIRFFGEEDFQRG